MPGNMRIISSIEDQEVVKTILKHLGLWLIRSRPPAKAHASPPAEYNRGGSPPLPMIADHIYGDPDYPWRPT